MSDDQVTISRELLRQVLDALEDGLHFRKTGLGRPPEQYNPPAIDALRAALEQPAVEPSAVFYRCNHCWHGYEDQPPSSCDCATGYGFERVEYFIAPQAQQPPRIGSGVTVEQTLEQWEHDFNNPMTTEQQVDWVKREREFAARQAQQPTSVQEPDVDYRSMYLKVRDDLAAAQQRLDTCEALARAVMNDQVGRA